MKEKHCYNLISDENLKTVILAKWDHVIGPKLIKVWFRKRQHIDLVKTDDGLLTFSSLEELINAFHLDRKSSGCLVCKNISNLKHERKFYDILLNAVKYVISHSIVVQNKLDVLVNSHENIEEHEDISFKYLIIPDKGLNSLSCIFPVYENSYELSWCISVIIDYDLFQFNAKIKLFFVERLKSLSYKIKEFLLLNDTETLNSYLSSHVSKLFMDISTIQNKSLSDILFQEDLLMHTNQRFFQKVITSHLQTAYHSLVVGTSEKEVNQVLNFLACFSFDEDLSLCCSIVKNFIPGLDIQGMVLCEQSVPISFNDILDHSFPCTIIDLKNTIVWQKLSHNLFQNKIPSKLSSNTATFFLLRNEKKQSNIKDLFQPVEESSKLVNDLFKILFKLDVKDWKNAILLFMRQLLCKANILIETISKFFEKEKNNTQRNHPVRLKSWLNEILNLEEYDIRIILCIIEQYHKEIYDMIITSN